MIERTFIQQGLRKIELEEYLKKQLDRAGFTTAQIIKTPLVTRIVVNVTHPGLAIGRGGSNIKTLTNAIEKNFKIDNPQLEIKEIPNPELNAQAQVDKMKNLIERGHPWKSVAFRTVKEIQDAGAEGMELILKGKLSGKGERKRKQRIVHGYMKKTGNQVKFIESGKASAYPKAGAIGITLNIVKPETVFPDKIDFEERYSESVVKKEVEVLEESKEKKVDVKETTEEHKENKPKIEVKEHEETKKMPKEKTEKAEKETKKINKTEEKVKTEEKQKKENQEEKEE